MEDTQFGESSRNIFVALSDMAGRWHTQTMSLPLSNPCPLSRAVHSFSDSFLPGVHKSGGVR